MGMSPKMLMDGERVLISTRTHVKAVLLPAVLLIVVAFAGSFLAATVWSIADGWLGWAVVALAAVLVIWGTLLPFLRWITWTYTLTDQRIVEQKGILKRTGRIIPLNRINDVSYEKSLLDRLLGCGTLVIRNAAEEAGLQLIDIPHITDFHREVSSNVHGGHGHGGPGLAG